MDTEKLGMFASVGFFALFFLLMFGCAFIDLVVHFDFAPASGDATGYIYYQEKGGIYQLEWVCWRDMPFSDCEWFDPLGKTYQPGKYVMHYECTTFVWAWEHPTECYIVNATRTGDIT